MKRQLALTPGLATAALAAMLGSGYAQPSVDARLAVALDALEPGAFEGETRGTAMGTFAPELAFASQRGRVYYRLDGGSYNTPGDWSFFSHALGASYRLDLADADKARLHCGASGSWRRNGEAWSEADYDALGAFVNVELRPRSGVTLRTGYAFADRNFAHLSELDQLEHDAFASLHLNLQTRTTLIAESHVGGKSYRGEALVQVVPVSTSSRSPSGSGNGRNGSGMGPGVRAATFLPPAGTAGENARQWNALLRVAQGMGERTGAWVQGFVRRTGGRVPPEIVATPAGFFDDGVYDDPFASDLGALSAGLKHLFAGGAEVQAWGSWQQKDFTGVVALDEEGMPQAGDLLRSDRVTRGSVSISLPMPAPRAFSLGLELGYGFTLSRSNDAFHDYRSHAIGLALTVGR